MKKLLSIISFFVTITICIVAFAKTSEERKAIILQDICLGCGACEPVCPRGAIIPNDDGTYIVVRDLCNGCGLCMDVCPAGAIWLEEWGK